MTCFAVWAAMRPKATDSMGSSMYSPTWISGLMSTASIRRISRSGDSSSASSGCTSQRRKVSYSPVWRSMETRASISPPCFLRVADASAASSASNMTFLSTPFSLETASTTSSISLFITCSSRSTFQFMFVVRHQSRLGHVGERQLVQLAIHLDQHLAGLEAAQGARVTLAPVARHREFEPGPLAGEAREVRLLAQRPVQPRRRHLEGVVARDRVLHVQHGTHLPAHDLAIVHRH